MVDFNGNVNVDNKENKELTNAQCVEKINKLLKYEKKEWPYEAEYDEINLYPDKEALKEAVNVFVDTLHFVKCVDDNRNLICTQKVEKENNNTDFTTFIRNGATNALFMGDGDPEETIKWFREGYYASQQGGERYKKYMRDITKKLLEYNPSKIDRRNPKDIFKEFAFTSTIGLVTTFLQSFGRELQNELREKDPASLLDIDNKLQMSFRDQDILYRICARIRADYPKGKASSFHVVSDPAESGPTDSTNSVSGIYSSFLFGHKMAEVNSDNNQDLVFELPYTFSGNCYGRNDFEYNKNSAQDIFSNFACVQGIIKNDYSMDEIGKLNNQYIVVGAAKGVFENLANLYTGQGNLYQHINKIIGKDYPDINESGYGSLFTAKSIYINGECLCDKIDDLCERNNFSKKRNGFDYVNIRDNIAISILAKALQNPKDTITTMMFKIDEKYNVVPVPINVKKDYSTVIREATKIDKNKDKLNEIQNLNSIQEEKFKDNRVNNKYSALIDFCNKNGKYLDEYNKTLGVQNYENAKGEPYLLNKTEENFVEGETKDAVNYYQQLKGEKLYAHNAKEALYLLRDLTEKYNRRSIFGQIFRPSSYTITNLCNSIKKDLKELGVSNEIIEGVEKLQNKFSIDSFYASSGLEELSKHEMEKNAIDMSKRSEATVISDINERNHIDLSEEFDKEYVDELDENELDESMTMTNERTNDEIDIQ